MTKYHYKAADIADLAQQIMIAASKAVDKDGRVLLTRGQIEDAPLAAKQAIEKYLDQLIIVDDIESLFASLKVAKR